MSELFWLIFWGVVFTAGGAGIAVLFSGTWWIGAIIGFVVYLVILACAGGGNFTYIDLDFGD